jgi:hypothetical protein
MKYGLIVESWKKYLTEEDITSTSTITTDSSQPITNTPTTPTEQDSKDKTMSTILSSVENAIHDAKAVADKTSLDKSALKTALKAQIDKIIQEELSKIILEKDDRCTRLAKQKYDTWPSAYASGAVVRCRQGKIWKNE